MTEAQKREMYLRMERGEIPWGLIGGEHPGAVGNRVREDWQATLDAAYASGDPAQYVQVMQQTPYGINEHEQALIDAYRNDPNHYELRGGHLAEKKNPILNSLQNPAIGIPAFFGAAVGLPALLGGGGAAAGGAASGVPTIPSYAAGTYGGGSFAGLGGAGLGGLNAAGAAGAGAAGAAGAAAGAGGATSVLDRVLGEGSVLDKARNALGLRDYAGLGVAGLSALLGSREPAAMQDLQRVLALAENRVNAAEPLFNQLNTMAQAQMPKYTRGE